MRSALLLPFLLASCATPVQVPKIVRVAVPVYCKATVPAAPRLAISRLSSASTDAQVARAYVESLIAEAGFGRHLQLILSACVSPSR